MRYPLNRSCFWVGSIQVIHITAICLVSFMDFQRWLVIKVLSAQINLLNLLDSLLFLILICEVVNVGGGIILCIALQLLQACRPLSLLFGYSCLLCWRWAGYHCALASCQVIRDWLIIVGNSILLYHFCALFLSFHTNYIFEQNQITEKINIKTNDEVNQNYLFL